MPTNNSNQSTLRRSSSVDSPTIPKKRTGRKRPTFRPIKLNLDSYSHSLPACLDKSSKFFQNSSPCQVFNHVWLGSQADANNIDYIKENGFTGILTIMLKPLSADVRSQMELKHYKHIQVQDCSTSDLYSHFEEAMEFFDAHQQGKILVHCQQGISRSSTVCLAYLLNKTGKNFETCYKELQEKRSIISPNFGFLGQLKKYEDELVKSRENSPVNSPSPTKVLKTNCAFPYSSAVTYLNKFRAVEPVMH